MLEISDLTVATTSVVLAVSLLISSIFKIKEIAVYIIFILFDI